MYASPLALPAACALPRCLTSAAASTSCPTATPAVVPATCAPRRASLSRSSSRQKHHALARQPRGQLQVVRITGRREEYELEGITDPEDVWGEEANTEFVEIDTIPVYDPHKGPVHGRFFREADDERTIKDISIEDTAYWCSPDNAGELPRKRTVRALVEEEVELAHEMLFIENDPHFPPRLKLHELQEGDMVTGIVTDMWLFHGVLVDILCEYKGLIAVRQTEWIDVHDWLTPGEEVLCRIHKMPEWPKYRFPIHLELLQPTYIRDAIIRAEDYSVPADVGWAFEQGWDIQEVAAELGRHYEDQTGILEPDHADVADALDYRFGFDTPDTEAYPGDWLTREVLDEPAVLRAAEAAARAVQLDD